jgi:hypothetical protein
MTDNILSSLPLLKGWELAGSKQKNVEVAEKKKDLVDVLEKGYLAWSICSTNDAKAELSFLSDGKLLAENLLTAKDLLSLGLVAPNPLGLFCPIFDVVNEIFVIMFMPPTPWPYAESLKIKLKTEKQILHLHSFEHSAVKIVNEAVFKQGLKDLSK